MSSLTYPRFEMQNYLKLDGSDSYWAQTLFRYRVRMASYGDNFKGSHSPIMCPLCGVHIDSQINSFEKWQEIQKKVKSPWKISRHFQFKCYQQTCRNTQTDWQSEGTNDASITNVN